MFSALQTSPNFLANVSEESERHVTGTLMMTMMITSVMTVQHGDDDDHVGEQIENDDGDVGTTWC